MNNIRDLSSDEMNRLRRRIDQLAAMFKKAPNPVLSEFGFPMNESDLEDLNYFYKKLVMEIDKIRNSGEKNDG